MGYRRHGWLVGMVLAALAVTPAWADDGQYKPSAANGCGRLQKVRLTPIYSTRRIAPYPEDAQRRSQAGQTILRLLIDKYGFARNPEVVISSGYAQLDQAAIDSIRDRWRWEPPPPECQESGVVISETYNWNLRGPGSKEKPSPIYLDDPLYPGEARARKQGGTGEVEYTISPDNKVTDAHVTSSTGSPALDAAMIAQIQEWDQDWVLPASATASTSYTAKHRLEFIPHDDPVSLKVLMGPAIIPNPADLPGKPPHFTIVELYPAPSRANDCGRAAPVFLEAGPVNAGPRYPIEALSSGKQGRTVLDLLVDKSGTVSEATVAESSGSPILDEAAVKGMKGLYHYQAPPPECADQGVRLRDHLDWGAGSGVQRIMAGDPAYPAEAVAAKLSGSGVVQIVRSQDGDLVSTKVLTSTNSPVLDAAMVKYATDMRFTPGTKEFHRASNASLALEFLGDPDAMRAAAAAPVRRIAPPAPPPSTANDCGRGGDVYLAPMDNSHVLVPIPMVTVEPATRFRPAQILHAQGALKMQVIVDKDGKPASVTVAASSAPPDMERVVTGTVKENYRWAPPPPECADRGVMLNVNYVYTWAPVRLQIYADDPDYPDAARAKSMGAAGVVQIRYHDNQIDDAKVIVSTNVPELDAAMIRVVSDRLLADMRADPKPRSALQNFALMFMPAFVSSPRQLAAQRSQAQAGAQTTAQSAPP